MMRGLAVGCCLAVGLVGTRDVLRKGWVLEDGIREDIDGIVY